MIREMMGVVALDGRLVGTVSRVDGDAVRVTSVKGGRGFDHMVPLAWVSGVDSDRYVFLDKSSRFIAANWAEADARPERRMRPKAA